MAPEETGMALTAFPLLLLPFAIYNMIAFLTPGVSWAAPLFSIRMISNAELSVTLGDLLLMFAILLLFGEIVKATRLGTKAIVDHMLSLVLFIVMLAEFIIVDRAASSVFMLLLVISFVDVIAGFTVTIRTAQRDIALDTVDKITSS
jgi:hypothetical protein